jgi:hypothetical protein
MELGRGIRASGASAHARKVPLTAVSNARPTHFVLIPVIFALLIDSY